MNWLQSRIRPRIPLKLWLIGCFALSVIFCAIYSSATAIVVNHYGTFAECNPVLRALFEKIGVVWGLIALQIIGFTVIAIILIWLYKLHCKYPEKHSFFPSLRVGHFILITFLVTALNDFSYVGSGYWNNLLSFAQIFGRFYPFSVFILFGLSFLLTLFVQPFIKTKVIKESVR